MRVARRRILFIGSAQAITKTRKWVLQHAGYSVTLVQSAGAAVRALQRGHIDLLLVGIVNRSVDLTGLVAAVRRQNVPVISLSPPCGLTADAYVQPLAGPEGLLRTVGEAIVRAHGHAADEADCVMFVDRQRRYFHVTDSAAELIGYSREELLGRRIDDIAAPEMDVPGKFRQYVRQGTQHGVFHLKHRTGSIIPVRYAAKVLEDGCMVSRLKKLPARAA